MSVSLNVPEPLPGRVKKRIRLSGLSRRISLGALVLLFCILATILGDYYFQLLRISSVLGFTLKRPVPVELYDHLFGHNVSISNTSIPGEFGPIQIRIYAPNGVAHPPPMVFVHGFADAGNNDPYLNDVAARLAPMGFYVVLPTIPGEVRHEMTPRDLNVIANTISWTARQTNQKVSVFGISFGAGLTVPAATQPSVIPYVKLIFCISGYNDLQTIGRRFIHDRVVDPEGHPYPGGAPGPLVIAGPYLKELVPPDEVSDLTPAVQRFYQTEGNPLAPDDPALKHLTPRERADFDDLQRVQTAEMHDRYAALLQRHSEEMKAISPASVLSQVKVPLYILHGKYDRIFPPGEVEWMRKEIGNNPNAHILVTPWISHAFVGAPATRWDKFRTMDFCAEMLNQVAHREYLQN